MTGPDPLLAAEVVLRSAGGRLEGPRTPISSDNLGDQRPPFDTVAAATEFFRRQGFSVGEPGGISFTVAGPKSLFERVFGSTLTVTEERNMTTTATADGALELPLDRIPAEVAEPIEAVTFTPPPDYGPTNV
jgi:hypothetical protein